MKLGEKLKQARLEAGLSQRQLCGDALTRNMLSLIENGSARPSMETLRYLAGQLEKPISWFLEEQTVTSPNQMLMEQARRADPGTVLALLKDYKSPDSTFDRERWLLEALSCLTLAEEALAAQKPILAVSLLEQAAQAGEKTPYYTAETERKRLLLLGQVGGDAAQVVAQLPDVSAELLLRAKAALKEGNPRKALNLLEGATPSAPQCRLRGDALFALGNFAEARQAYEQLGQNCTEDIYRRLEECCTAMEDYKGAYFYACKQR